MSLLSDFRALTSRQKHVIAASYLGWTLDAFDFFILVFILKDVAATFNASIKEVTLAITLTLAMRPLGALIFGLCADKYGRRIVLMIDVLIYSVLELASGFAPSLTALIVLRALYGIAMGGEWGVGASLTLESIPSKLRGPVSGILQAGYPSGYLLASIAFFFLYPLIGWRGMFIVGVLPALLVLYIRRSVDESPAFVAQQHKKETANPSIGFKELLSILTKALLLLISFKFSTFVVFRQKNPIGNIIAGFKGQWGVFIWAVLMMAGFNFLSHGTQDIYPTFLQQQRHLDTHQTGAIAIVYNIGAIIGGFFFGTLSEKIGRRKAIVIAALLVLPVLPLWVSATTPVELAIGAFLIQFFAQGAWGIVPVHLNEISPAALRGTFPGFAYQLGNLLASYNATLQAGLAVDHGGDYAFALAVVAGCAAVAVALLAGFGKEARGQDFTKQ